MIALLKRIKRALVFSLIVCIASIKKLVYKKERIVFLIGTPWHGNIGDQAIALAEILLIMNNTSKIIIEIPSQYMMWFKRRWKRVIGNCPILIHGGGFIGSLWPKEDEMIRYVINTFHDNKIIVLPQTIYFKDSTSTIVEEYRKIISKCTDITICAREKYSYNLSKKLNLPNVILIPDMVTYFKTTDFDLGSLKDGYEDLVLICLRDDCEKAIDDTVVDEVIKQNVNMIFRKTDTFENHTIYPFQRKKEVSKKIREFKNSRVVITDRLHGMVFSALAGTPCIVMSNCNNKIIGVYDWISNNENIIFVSEIDEVKRSFDTIKNAKRKDFNNERVIEFFSELKEMIERM